MTAHSLLLLLIYFLFVFPFLRRESEATLQKIELFKIDLTKIGTVLVLYTLACGFLFQENPFMFVVSQLITFIAFRLFSLWVRVLGERWFEEGKMFFINNIIHQIILGKSFRGAIQESLLLIPEKERPIYQNFQLDVVFSQQEFNENTSPGLVGLMNDLQGITNLGGSELSQLKQLREKYQKQNSLRHRSRGALIQLNVQMSVLVLFSAASLILQWLVFEEYIHLGSQVWGTLFVVGGLYWGLSLKKKVV